ncbi:M23 family metallopeptidase [Rhodobacterales bacterium]|nr:M23 family metallopeptidase [Rhodobacterales bacterium]
MQQRQEKSPNYRPPRTSQDHADLGRRAKSTSYTLRPTHLICGALACVTVTLGITGSLGYYLLRNDMMAEATAERTELVLEYQDHIDRLRTEIENLNSRQMVDRETVEIQVMDVLRRQQDLNQRHAIVADLVARAESAGIYLNNDMPLPPQKPSIDGTGLASLEGEDKSAIGGESELIDEPVKALGLRDTNSKILDPLTILQRPAIETGEPEAPAQKKSLRKRAALDAVKAHISSMDVESTAAVDAIVLATESRIEDILGLTRKITPDLNAALRKSTAIGGPFQPITDENFPNRIQRADTALKTFQRIKYSVLRLPIQRPVRNARVSSTYGPRVDPFLGRLSMHTGIDFKAPYGARVYATAPGTVITARRHGGYGNMVAIRHANGYITRYAHLSRFQISEGDHVQAGDLIGNVGSTGRSTGAHLHYEIRKGGKPNNPAQFLVAGDTLAARQL